MYRLLLHEKGCPVLGRKLDVVLETRAASIERMDEALFRYHCTKTLYFLMCVSLICIFLLPSQILAKNILSLIFSLTRNSKPVCATFTWENLRSFLNTAVQVLLEPHFLPCTRPFHQALNSATWDSLCSELLSFFRDYIVTSRPDRRYAARDQLRRRCSFPSKSDAKMSPVSQGINDGEELLVPRWIACFRPCQLP